MTATICEGCGLYKFEALKMGLDFYTRTGRRQGGFCQPCYNARPEKMRWCKNLKHGPHGGHHPIDYVCNAMEFSRTPSPETDEGDPPMTAIVQAHAPRRIATCNTEPCPFEISADIVDEIYSALDNHIDMNPMHVVSVGLAQ